MDAENLIMTIMNHFYTCTCLLKLNNNCKYFRNYTIIKTSNI